MDNIFKKIVRDKIPEIAKSNNSKVEFYKANEEEFLEEIFKKILEEAKEVFEERKNKEKLKEEFADLLEVFYKILEIKNISFEEIEKIRKQKFLERWWFNEKFIMVKNTL